MKNRKKKVGIFLALMLLVVSVTGCILREQEEKNNADLSADNVIITETGETLVKEQPTEIPAATGGPATEE